MLVKIESKYLDYLEDRSKKYEDLLRKKYSYKFQEVDGLGGVCNIYNPDAIIGPSQPEGIDESDEEFEKFCMSDGMYVWNGVDWIPKKVYMRTHTRHEFDSLPDDYKRLSNGYPIRSTLEHDLHNDNFPYRDESEDLDDYKWVFDDSDCVSVADLDFEDEDDVICPVSEEEFDSWLNDKPDNPFENLYHKSVADMTDEERNEYLFGDI